MYQPVNSIGVGYCTFSSQLTGTGIWGKTSSRRRQGGLGAEPPALDDFRRFTTKIIHF